MMHGFASLPAIRKVDGYVHELEVTGE